MNDKPESTLSEQADLAISTELGEQTAKVAGAVWLHNLDTTGSDMVTINTVEGHTVESVLRPSDVTDLICAFLFPVMQTVHKDNWKLTLSAEFDLWLEPNGNLSDYGIVKWGMLVNHIANVIDHVGYGDAKH
ncbi:TPA: hypothetical protein MEE63_003270 [Klebsiella aerogenes]|uniref:hypothetical protein n=1 Tax=Klebsiella TaxID=570 RepID=UPI001D0E311C|nr:hypothetical protein [Klebsiella aerogenes]MBF8483770.1 hypothetical protein [Klebsiella aerogenes]HBW0982198.1 hypothetical protein [Klebsiella aerogenes]HBW0985620.1 hypothetical protein [Klebsiella aerogenes]